MHDAFGRIIIVEGITKGQILKKTVDDLIFFGKIRGIIEICGPLIFVGSIKSLTLQCESSCDK